MVSEALDQTDLIKQAYSLEVSSPRLQRTLKLPRDAERFAGQIISARLFSLHEGRWQFKGRLAGIDGERLALVEEGDVQCLIPLSLIAEAHLDPEIRF